MRIPLSWLRSLVDWEQDADALAEALTARGVAVEAIERPGGGASGVLAARILSVQGHPTAERLHLCRVQAGATEATVVCGAPELHGGMLVPWAQPGAVLPGGRSIEARPVAGTLSEGMLCAPDELGVPGGHDGLLDLRAEGLEPGADVVAALDLDDPVLVLELTPNYAAHCQSILGVAREVAALTGGALRLPAAVPAESGETAAISVRLADAALCPLYVARVLGGIGPAALPLRLRLRLQRCGLRPLGGVVDVTNYVMLELGQPLHAFDRQRLAGGLQVRAARAGESMVTLDGRQHRLDPADVVIADDEGPIALAGVMGGQRCEVRPETTEVVLESAVFDAGAVARTARRHGLPSEAAGRFGRGVDPNMTRTAAERAAHLAQELLGATVRPGRAVVGPGVPPVAVTLRGRRARTLLGLRLSTAACGRQLEGLGFKVAADGADRLRVTVPGFRPDVTAEIDLIEEIARAYGYDRLPALLPGGDPGVSPPHPLAAPSALARSLALGAGYNEVQPYSYHAPEVWDRLHLPVGHPWRRAVAVANPMSADQSLLRTNLLSGLLQILELNARRGRADAAVFEVGRVFQSRDGARPAEPRRLGVAGYGALQPATWNRPADACDFFAVKGLFEEILARLGVPPRQARWERHPADYPMLHPGRSACLVLEGRLLGWLGETHPEVTAAYGLPGPAAVGELELEALAALPPQTASQGPLPRFPAVRRDLALLAPRALLAGEIEERIRHVAGPLLVDVHPFDVYTGEGVSAGSRSVAFTLTYQAERTLTDTEVDAVHSAVRAALAGQPGIVLRS